MTIFERAVIPAKYRTKFVRAVDAQRRFNRLYGGKTPTDAQIERATSALYKAMSALPVALQVIAKRRAK